MKTILRIPFFAVFFCYCFCANMNCDAYVFIQHSAFHQMKTFSKEKSFVWALLFWFFSSVFPWAVYQNTAIHYYNWNDRLQGKRFWLCQPNVVLTNWSKSVVFKFERWEFVSPVSAQWIAIKSYIFCICVVHINMNTQFFFAVKVNLRNTSIFVTTVQIFFPYSDRRLFVTLST